MYVLKNNVSQVSSIVNLNIDRLKRLIIKVDLKS